MKYLQRMLWLYGMVAFLLFSPECRQSEAQEVLQHDPLGRSPTYIRYHLLSNSDPDSTLDPKIIRTLDAYFEFPSDVAQQLVPQTRSFHLIEARQASDGGAVPPAGLLAARLSSMWHDLVAIRTIGRVAFSLGYNGARDDQLQEGRFKNDLYRITGILNLPLGETGFAFGASLGMYVSRTLAMLHTSADTREQAAPEPNPLSAFRNSSMMQFAWTGSSGSPSPASSRTISPVSDLNHVVVGAVNVSGAVKGVNVFTEVGMTSRSQAPALAEEATLANFYAMGGANYTIGQVTLGVEAGFENGETVLETAMSESLGFEHDFWVDSQVESDNASAQPSKNTIYTKVSARMSPTERMTVEGALSYLHPLEEKNAAPTPGFEVNGAFYYSLTNYLKYLVKAGMSSTVETWQDSQYTVTNQLEFSF